MHKGIGIVIKVGGTEIPIEEWTLDSRFHTKKKGLGSQLRGGSEMNEKVKVGDKVRYRFDKDGILGARVGMVAEVVKVPDGSGPGVIFNPQLNQGDNYTQFEYNPLLTWEKFS